MSSFRFGVISGQHDEGVSETGGGRNNHETLFTVEELSKPL